MQISNVIDLCIPHDDQFSFFILVSAKSIMRLNGNHIVNY